MSIKMIETENIVEVHLKLLMQVAMQKKENTESHILLASIWCDQVVSVWWLCRRPPCFLWSPAQHTGDKAELLSKHLEFIHSQSGFRGCWVGGVWEKEGNKRASGRQWERNARESATFFLLKLIKYGPGLLKTRGLPEDWLCPGPGRLCSLLNCTLHCSHKAPRTVLTHIHTSKSCLLQGFHLVFTTRWADGL